MDIPFPVKGWLRSSGVLGKVVMDKPFDVDWATK